MNSCCFLSKLFLVVRVIYLSLGSSSDSVEYRGMLMSAKVESLKCCTVLIWKLASKGLFTAIYICSPLPLLRSRPCLPPRRTVLRPVAEISFQNPELSSGMVGSSFLPGWLSLGLLMGRQDCPLPSLRKKECHLPCIIFNISWKEQMLSFIS